MRTALLLLDQKNFVIYGFIPSARANQLCSDLSNVTATTRVSYGNNKSPVMNGQSGQPTASGGVPGKEMKLMTQICQAGQTKRLSTLMLLGILCLVIVDYVGSYKLLQVSGKVLIAELMLPRLKLRRRWPLSIIHDIRV
uniref:Uncharacterized protein n=3 Tax=Brassica TaxID=3705 RepID=M4E574_BRACM